MRDARSFGLHYSETLECFATSGFGAFRTRITRTRTRAELRVSSSVQFDLLVTVASTRSCTRLAQVALSSTAAHVGLTQRGARRVNLALQRTHAEGGGGVLSYANAHGRMRTTCCCCCRLHVAQRGLQRTCVPLGALLCLQRMMQPALQSACAPLGLLATRLLVAQRQVERRQSARMLLLVLLEHPGAGALLAEVVEASLGVLQTAGGVRQVERLQMARGRLLRCGVLRASYGGIRLVQRMFEARRPLRVTTLKLQLQLQPADTVGGVLLNSSQCALRVGGASLCVV